MSCWRARPASRRCGCTSTTASARASSSTTNWARRVAGFAVAEIEKHFAGDRYGHLDRHEARRLASEQADYLWQQQYGRY